MSRYVRLFLVVGLALGGCTAPRLGVPAAEAECTACHGDATRGGDPLRQAAPPLGVHLNGPGRTDTGYPGVGAHEAHLGDGALAQAVECNECHVVPRVDGRLTTDAPGHLGTGAAGEPGALRAELAFGGRAIAGGVNASYDYDQHTCTTYCHGATLSGGTNPTPTWNAVGQGEAACGTCHGNPPTSAGHPQSDRCASCHPTVMADGRIDAALHINGKVDLAEPTCRGCHGSDANAAPPVDTAGRSDTSLPSVGAHQAHVQEGSAARAFACSECHITPDPTTDLYGHVNGIAEVDFGALSSTDGATPTWSGTTCSTYCHGATLSGGSNTAPEWTRVDGTQAACGSCHGLPPTGPGHPQSTKCSLCHPTVDRDLNFVDKARHVDGVVDLVTDYSCNRCHGSAANAAPPVDTGGRSETNRRGVGAHQAHVAPGAAAIAAPLACSACHNPLPSPADPIAHVDGVAAVSFGALARADGAAPSWNGSTCTTYCHGQTLGGGSNTSPIWTVGDGSQDACGTCHGLPPSLPHPQTSPTGCGDCHPNVSRDGSGQWVFADVSLHVNGHVEENAPTTCNACHGSVDNAAPPVDSQGRSNPALTSVGAHQAHVVPGFFADAIPCQDCHVVPTDLSHIDGVAQVTFGGLAAARSATTSWNGSRCSVYCHGTPLSGGSVMTPLWTGGATQVFCGSCHGMPPVTNLHPVVSPTSCATCHGDVVNADLTWKNKSLHCDGVVEYGGSGT